VLLLEEWKLLRERKPDKEGERFEADRKGHDGKQGRGRVRRAGQKQLRMKLREIDRG